MMKQSGIKLRMAKEVNIFEIPSPGNSGSRGFFSTQTSRSSKFFQEFCTDLKHMVFFYRRKHM